MACIMFDVCNGIFYGQGLVLSQVFFIRIALLDGRIDLGQQMSLQGECILYRVSLCLCIEVSKCGDSHQRLSQFPLIDGRVRWRPFIDALTQVVELRGAFHGTMNSLVLFLTGI